MPATRFTRDPSYGLPQTSGSALALSNDQLLTEFGGLVKHVVGQVRRAFRFSDEQADDLEYSLLAKLFAAKPSYRNSRGVSIILKTQKRDLIKKLIKHEPEHEMGLLRGGEGLEILDTPEPHDFEDVVNRYIEPELVSRHLDCLSSPERAVLGMTYGLDGCAVCTDGQIAKKLGKDIWWVSRKREQGILKLQRTMRLEQSLEGL